MVDWKTIGKKAIAHTHTESQMATNTVRRYNTIIEQKEKSY